MTAFDDRLGLTGSKRLAQISLFMVFKMDWGTYVTYDPIDFGDIQADGQVWGISLQSQYTSFSPDTINIFAGFHGAERAVLPRCAALGMWHSISVVTDRVMRNTTFRANGIDAQVLHPHVNVSISVPIGNSTGTGMGQIAGPDGTQPPPGRTAAKCDIAEVILYDIVLSDSLRRSVEHYIGMKYHLPPGGEIKSRW